MTIRRLKTYTGSQGYVYQYYFVGKRPGRLQEEGLEYVFDVTSDRKTIFPVAIFLSNAAVAAWNQSHGRRLSDSEQYAAVKMRLFRAFDEIEDVASQACTLPVDVGFLTQALAELGVG